MTGGGVAAETIYSKDDSKILAAERAEIFPENPQKLLGLALSGGGIRSASFALGVLQALHGSQVFDKFHYLSTVSGGGYIGSALTYFRNIFADRFGANWFPFGYLRKDNGKVQAMGARIGAPDHAQSGNDIARRIVSFLRQHAGFLVPSRQLGVPALIAGALRGLLTTALPYFALLAAIMGLLIAFELFAPPEQVKMLESWLAPAAQPAAPAPVLVVCPPDPCAAPPAAPAPAFFLAAWPALAALAIAVLFLVISIGVSLAGGLISRFDHGERTVRFGYRAMIQFFALAGWALAFGAAALLAATLPWVWKYLSYLLDAQAGEKLPGTFAALASAIGGALALIGKMRGVLGGAEQKPSLLRGVWMSLAGVAFVYGIFLLAYIAALSLVEMPVPAGWQWIASCLAWLGLNIGAFWPGVVLILALVATFLINVNHAAQHRLYRDRLMEVFCAEEDALTRCAWAPALRANSRDGWLRNLRRVERPFHLINAAILTTDSPDRRFRGRGGDNFILSPLYCGSDATGWAKTAACMPTMSIATAAAISGAALNAHTGPHGAGLLRNKAYAAVLSFLGLHLGYWARNPVLYKDVARAPVTSDWMSRAAKMVGWSSDKFVNLPKLKFANLLIPGLSGVSGIELNERGHFVQLSDGGHFENLAIYELIRRKVDFLWVSDAGQDGGFSFEDLSNAIERVRVDFGVNIRFPYDAHDLTHLIPGSVEAEGKASQNFAAEYQLATRGYAIGIIQYPAGPGGERVEDGTIVYVKSTLTRFLPGDLYGYKARNADFPHQTTLDQFFDEEQFEAYRELGYRLASKLFRDIEDGRKKANTPNRATGSEALDKVAGILGI